MTQRRWQAVCLLLAVALPGMACGEPEHSKPARGGVEITLTVVDSEGRVASSFAAGTLLGMRLTLTNHGGSEVALPFASTKTHDAIVLRDDGTEVWRWSRGRMFAQMLSEIPLAPGASRHFEARCDPSRAGGELLPPGRYQAVGLIPILGNEIRSAPVPFVIAAD